MKKKKSFPWWGWVILVCLLPYLQYLIPLAALGLGAWGFYHYHQSKNRLSQGQIEARIDHLKLQIRQADGQLQELESLHDPLEDSNYQELSTEVLSQLRQIGRETESLKRYLDQVIYERIQERIKLAHQDIQTHLEKIEDRKFNQQAETIQTDLPLDQLPTEIAQTVENIRIDHQAILEKIHNSDSGNKEELTAVHQSQMERYEKILEGYLKIKASPKDYHNAQERLELAQAAMEQFDRDLDDTLKELNEADMRDFDISLRIITNDKLKS